MSASGAQTVTGGVKGNPNANAGTDSSVRASGSTQVQ
jgi:hypothetical protein